MKTATLPLKTTPWIPVTHSNFSASLPGLATVWVRTQQRWTQLDMITWGVLLLFSVVLDRGKNRLRRWLGSHQSILVISTMGVRVSLEQPKVRFQNTFYLAYVTVALLASSIRLCQSSRWLDKKNVTSRGERILSAWKRQAYSISQRIQIERGAFWSEEKW